jgi:hypothetical protein
MKSATVAAFVVVLPYHSGAGAGSTAGGFSNSRLTPVRRVVLYKSGVGYFEHLGACAAIRRSRSISPAGS